jgi:hypothetical protein
VSRVSGFASETRLVDLRFQSASHSHRIARASNGGVDLAFLPHHARIGVSLSLAGNAFSDLERHPPYLHPRTRNPSFTNNFMYLMETIECSRFGVVRA